MTTTSGSTPISEMIGQLFGETHDSSTRPSGSGEHDTGGSQAGASGQSSTNAAASSSQQFTISDITKICMYSQAVPVITQERLLELEAQLPAFVEFLKALESRPLALAQFQEFVNSAGNEAVQPKQSQELLAKRLGAPDSVSGDSAERFLPLVAVCIGAAALGYNIGHTWGR
jgi:hypothetical protein